MAEKSVYYGTGRRKEAVARVRVMSGKGDITVNGIPASQYLQREALELLMKQPLEAVALTTKFDVKVRVDGGGISGQAGAIRHGIARALLQYDDALRSVLRKGGFLTRDPRAKERKKYGQRGARARFQFSKR